MRILLTGGAGFIGSHLAESLLERGDEVVALDNFDPFYAPSLKDANLDELARWPGFCLVRGDIRDQRLLQRLFESDDFDAVVHLAARAGVRPSIDEPDTYVDVNLRGTTVVLESARLAGVRRAVVASSSSVYGADSPRPFHPSARADRPVSTYAATKRAAELLCEAFASLHSMSIVSLRYFTVYGPRQRPDMAISRFIRAIDRGEVVARFGDGRAVRDYTYVSDAVAATVAALDATADGQPGHRIFNVGESRTCSLDELLRIIERALGKTAVVEEHGDQRGDVPVTHADIEETRRALGYDPKVGIEEGIRRQVEWYQERKAARDEAAPKTAPQPGATGGGDE